MQTTRKTDSLAMGQLRSVRAQASMTGTRAANLSHTCSTSQRTRFVVQTQLPPRQAPSHSAGEPCPSGSLAASGSWSPSNDSRAFQEDHGGRHPAAATTAALGISAWALPHRARSAPLYLNLTECGRALFDRLHYAPLASLQSRGTDRDTQPGRRRLTSGLNGAQSFLSTQSRDPVHLFCFSQI